MAVHFGSAACTLTADDFEPTLVVAPEPGAQDAPGRAPTGAGMGDAVDGPAGQAAADAGGRSDDPRSAAFLDDAAPEGLASDTGEGTSAEAPQPDAGGRPPPLGDLEADPARIVSAFPADGARGVAPDVVLVIDFGRAMDTSTLPGALVSDDISFTGASLEWTADDSVVRISLAAPLALARGNDPARVDAVCHTYRITEAALDAAGRATTAESVRFCTARRIAQRLAALIDPDLTGNFRSDGINGDGSCARASDAVCVGDSGAAANSQYRGFLTFGSSELPNDIELLDAELRLQIRATSGTPLDDLGVFIVEQARFASIGIEAFREDSPVLGPMRTEPGDPSTLLLNVTAALRELDSRREQFRLRFAEPTDGDGLADHVTFRPGEAALQLEYLVP